MSKVPDAQYHVDNAPGIINERQKPSSGWGAFGHAVAKVVAVNAQDLTITLSTKTGENDTQHRVPIQMTFPEAGARRFLGSIPDIGDMCMIGWTASESGGGSKRPVIVAWLVPGAWLGHDWVPTQSHGQDEFDLDSPKRRAELEGLYGRTRHKLRHLEPGNVLASSSQGSDLVLDEGVLLTNRRGNEIRLRDQDQAFLSRAIMQHHAMAGARVQAGPVQRDALLLPTQMFSDGRDWASWRQIGATGQIIPPEEGLTETDIVGSEAGDAHTEQQGRLTPADVFRRTAGKATPESGLVFRGRIDPYEFLQAGSFITATGHVADPAATTPDAVYGGKALYRVAADISRTQPVNAAAARVPVFTEHRVEVSHTSDGTLPVTEQTDGFDADRLPNDPQGGHSPNDPFIEVVYGSVVGNDPYGKQERALYGLPLRVQVQQGGRPAPAVLSAVGSPIGEHAASLFRLRPVAGTGVKDPSFLSFTKDGRVRFSIAPAANSPWSLEGAFGSGAWVSFGGDLELRPAGFFVRGTGPAEISSSGGPVRVYGGGATESQGTGEPSVVVEGRRDVLVKAGGNIRLSADSVEMDCQSVRYAALGSLTLGAGDKVSVSAGTLDQVTSGQASYLYGGPKGANPANGALRVTQFSGTPATGTNPGGVVDDYEVPFGGRSERFGQGDHTTSIAVGNMTYETTTGGWTAKAGLNTLGLHHANGLDAQINTGNAGIYAKAGTATVEGTAAATVRTSGAANLSGTTGVTLGGPGKTGGIVCGSDVDPVSGLPLSLLGMGSPGHLLGLPL